MCDDCGQDGDLALEVLAFASVGFILAIVLLLPRAGAGLLYGLFTVQVSLALAAYLAAGSGAGNVRIAPGFPIAGAVFQAFGAAAIQLTTSRGPSSPRSSRPRRR